MIDIVDIFWLYSFFRFVYVFIINVDEAIKHLIRELLLHFYVLSKCFIQMFSVNWLTIDLCGLIRMAQIVGVQQRRFPFDSTVRMDEARDTELISPSKHMVKTLPIDIPRYSFPTWSAMDYEEYNWKSIDVEENELMIGSSACGAEHFPTSSGAPAFSIYTGTAGSAS